MAVVKTTVAVVKATHSRVVGVQYILGEALVGGCHGSIELYKESSHHFSEVSPVVSTGRLYCASLQGSCEGGGGVMVDRYRL